MLSLHQDLARDCSWDWFFSGVGQFVSVGCLCVHMWDFCQGDYIGLTAGLWCLAPGCVFEGFCTSLTMVGQGGKGLQAALILLSFSHSCCPAGLLLHRPWWPCRECAAVCVMFMQGFVCGMEVWYLCSLSTSPEVDQVDRRGFCSPVLVQRWGGWFLAFLLLHRDIIVTNLNLHLCFAHSIKKNLGSLMCGSVGVIWLCIVCQAPHPWTFSAFPGTTAAPWNQKFIAASEIFPWPVELLLQEKQKNNLPIFICRSQI